MDVITSNTTTATGMNVITGYNNPGSSKQAIRIRECVFPEGHYMKKTYGLDSLTVFKRGKEIAWIDAKGNILGQELKTLGTMSVEKFTEFLKSLKKVNKMTLDETIKDILRVGRHVCL